MGSIRACLILFVIFFFAGLFIEIFPSSGSVLGEYFSSAATLPGKVLGALPISGMEELGSKDGPKNPRILIHCFLQSQSP